MGSLVAGTPYVPSAPVQIGTPGKHNLISEAGSWQALLLMFVAVLVLGAAVLMFAVQQRTRVLKRRRIRRATGSSVRTIPLAIFTTPVAPRITSATSAGARARRPERVT